MGGMGFGGGNLGLIGNGCGTVYLLRGVGGIEYRPQLVCISASDVEI